MVLESATGNRAVGRSPGRDVPFSRSCARLMPNFAIFRADAGRTLGTGHVVRCQVLARALADLGWQCAFAVSAETLSVMPRLAGTEVRQLSGSDEPEELARLWPGGCDLLVVDHYERDAAFETACRSWARRLAAIDDLPGRPHVAPCVIDPGAGLTPAI